MAPVLRAESVWKRFRAAGERPTTLRETLLRAWRGERRPVAVERWALRDVSLAVEPGTALGVIGHNGAGKSTLLRLLCGVGVPTRGRIARAGAVGGLLELGGGFHLDLTGRENVLTAGLLNGLSRAEVRRREDAIVAFAELEEHIDRPLRTYSSGMYVRLAFAVAMELDPAVLVVDEVLAVGDVRFQRKCLDRIAAFRAEGRTLIVASHVGEQIRALCDEVLVLEDGAVVLREAPDAALRHYEDLMRERTERRAERLRNDGAPIVRDDARGRRGGTHEAVIERVRLLDARGAAVNGGFASDDALVVELDYRLARPIPDAALSLGIWSGDGVKCHEVCIASLRAAFGALRDAGTLRCRIPRLPLLPGAYWVDVGLYPPDYDVVYDLHWRMHALVVAVAGPVSPAADVSGLLALDARWSAD